jgi:CDP-diacylglycerol--glycerol-3-phosphate 3-phosphatidyltransferase
MFSSLIQDWARGIARQVARLVAKSHLTPNSLTIIGLLLNFPVAYVLAQGWFIWGGLLVIFAGVFDMLDGALAKVTGRVTQFGGFLDSTMDRYSEVIIFLGLLIFYQTHNTTDAFGGELQGLLLVYASITGSLLVSYTKARAEGLGMECKVGWLPRPERILIMALGCLIATWWSPALIIMLWLLAIGTNLTALQRITHIWLKSKDTVLEQPVFADSKPLTTVSSNVAAKETEEVLRKRWSFRRVHTR